MSLHTLLARPDIWRGDARGAIAQPVVSSGFAALDAALPGGGWPLGALTEVMPAHEGIGELRLLGPALGAVASSGRMVAWIAPPHLPYAPAIAAAGIDLARILVVRTRTPQETLWATEQALSANACGAVLAWPATKPAPRFPELRRLQLAVEGGRGIAAIFRPPEAARESSPAVLRIALETAAGGLAVRILKRRGAPLAQAIVLEGIDSPPAPRPHLPASGAGGSLPRASAQHRGVANAAVAALAAGSASRCSSLEGGASTAPHADAATHESPNEPPLRERIA